jgi:hypothetical protein
MELEIDISQKICRKCKIPDFLRSVPDRFRLIQIDSGPVQTRFEVPSFEVYIRVFDLN